VEPKVMVPRQRSDTTMPLVPSRFLFISIQGKLRAG
jgi:hypothetical protein